MRTSGAILPSELLHERRLDLVEAGAESRARDGVELLARADEVERAVGVPERMARLERGRGRGGLKFEEGAQWFLPRRGGTVVVAVHGVAREGILLDLPHRVDIRKAVVVERELDDRQ